MCEEVVELTPITKTCPCNIQRIFSAAKISVEKKKFFLIFAYNIDCGYAQLNPQSMFWSKNKTNRYTPCISQFCYMKAGFNFSVIFYSRGHTFHGDVCLMHIGQFYILFSLFLPYLRGLSITLFLSLNFSS